MRITLESNLKYHISKGGANPLLFEPEIDWAEFTEPNIIHAY